MRAGSLHSSILGAWLAWACGAAGSAQAQAPSALSWVREAGAEACIGAPELGARVERLVGPVLVAAPSAEVSVEGRIARKGRRFVATIVISDAHGAVLGVREVKGGDPPARQEPDCRALDDQLAFVIAVAIDPNAALAELPGELAPDDPGAELLADLEANPPQPAPVTPAAAAPVAPQRSRRKEAALAWHVVGAVGGFIGLGTLPGISGGTVIEVGGGASWLTQRARLGLMAAPRVVDDALARVALDWLELGTATCFELLGMPSVALELCGGPITVRLDAEPRGFDGDQQGGWLFGPRGDARVSVPLIGPVVLALEASVSSVWPKHRVIYETAREPREVYRVPPAGGSVSLLIELRLAE